jgi:hypothetical protein
MRILPFFHFHPIFLFVSLFLYFLPAYLARNKSNFTAILLLNVFAGWTFIGWIVALIWALSAEPQRHAAVPLRPATANAPPAAIAGFSAALVESSALLVRVSAPPAVHPCRLRLAEVAIWLRGIGLNRPLIVR